MWCLACPSYGDVVGAARTRDTDEVRAAGVRDEPARRCSTRMCAENRSTDRAVARCSRRRVTYNSKYAAQMAITTTRMKLLADTPARYGAATGGWRSRLGVSEKDLQRCNSGRFRAAVRVNAGCSGPPTTIPPDPLRSVRTNDDLATCHRCAGTAAADPPHGTPASAPPRCWPRSLGAR